MAKYEMLLLKDLGHGIEIIFNRLEKRNSINAKMLEELHSVLDELEKNPEWKILIIKGQCGIFCVGMDFNSVSEGGEKFASDYMRLLKRFASIPKIIISWVEGRVMAGGVGIVAASDFVISTPVSEFTLTELVWGLLPANVLPYLIRRVGFQKAYTMSLSGQKVSSDEAQKMGLADFLTEEPETLFAELAPQLLRISEITLQDFKNYTRKMWIINEEMEQLAQKELVRLVNEPHVKNNMKRFVETGKFPWEK